ncbi:MAG: ATP-binding protein [Bacillota bacterium]
MRVEHAVQGMDFTQAGRGTATIQRALRQVGMSPTAIRRATVVCYEAEMNIVIHAHRGVLAAELQPGRVIVTAADEGPGIPDIGLAMCEGYSTAPPQVREMGLGAGLGLPNIKRHADELDIQSVVGKGTTLRAVIVDDDAAGR